MTILCSVSFHEHPKYIMEHYLNWDAAFERNSIYIAHLSATTRKELLKQIAHEDLILSAPRFLINQKSIQTRFGTALPMHLVNYHFSKEIGLSPSYFYISSPQSFAVRSGLAEYVRSFDIGIQQSTVGLSNWYWGEAAQQDRKLAAFLRHLNVDQAYISRVDGAFIRTDIFEEMLAIIKEFWTDEEILSLDPVYPLEEIVIPTLTKAMYQNKVRVGDTRACVRGGEEMTLEQVQSVLDGGYYFSVKRIYQARTSASRKLVLSHLPGPAALKPYNTPTLIDE